MKRMMLLNAVLAGSVALALFTGCAHNGDAVSQAEKTDKTRPSIAETKAIAEEGFIYGLPIVMNCAIMYDYAIDRASVSSSTSRTCRLSKRRKSLSE